MPQRVGKSHKKYSRSAGTRRTLQKYTRKRRRQQKGGSTETPLAVIVEPRSHPALSFVLRNFHENLPPEWQILVLHSMTNEEFVKKAVSETGAPATRFRLRSLGVPSLSYKEYNAMMKEPAFYEKFIPAETFLIFQTDSMICGPHKDLLQKFLTYDYVGAPWKDRIIDAVGNGGLSLRKRSVVLAKLRACPAKDVNEDGYFADRCAAVPMKIPTKEEAGEFSIETMYTPKSFGVHKPWAHLMPHELSKLETQCPGVTTLHSLQEQK